MGPFGCLETEEGNTGDGALKHRSTTWHLQWVPRFDTPDDRASGPDTAVAYGDRQRAVGLDPTTDTDFRSRRLSFHSTAAPTSVMLSLCHDHQ